MYCSPSSAAIIWIEGGVSYDTLWIVYPRLPRVNTMFNGVQRRYASRLLLSCAVGLLIGPLSLTRIVANHSSCASQWHPGEICVFLKKKNKTRKTPNHSSPFCKVAFEHNTRLMENILLDKEDENRVITALHLLKDKVNTSAQIHNAHY